MTNQAKLKRNVPPTNSTDSHKPSRTETLTMPHNNKKKSKKINRNGQYRKSEIYSEKIKKNNLGTV